MDQFPLLFRGWFIGFTALLSCESSSLLFESSTLKPITISHLTADPNTILVSGISTTDSPFPFHYFAFLELRNNASSPNAQSTALRSSLFSDQKYSPSLWSHLVRQSLLLLGHDFQTLACRGQPLPTPASSTPPADDTANKHNPQKLCPSKAPLSSISKTRHPRSNRLTAPDQEVNDQPAPHSPKGWLQTGRWRGQ